MRSLRCLAAATLAAALLAGCGVATSPGPASTTAAFPLTVTDDLGRGVTLTSAPARIVSLSGAHTETLYALGVEDRIVAVDPFSDYPAAAKSKPRIGFSQLKPNVEQVVSLNPDLVVTHVEKQDFLQQMEARNIKALKLDPKDFEGIWKDMKILGQVTGREAKAEELVRGLQQRLRKVRDTVKNATRPRVFYELDATDPGKPFTVGPGSFVDAIIVAAGGANIASGLKKAFDQISTEEVVRQDPEIILLADANVPYNPVRPEDVGKRPGWSVLAAVRQQKVRAIDGSIASRPGPRIVDAVENVAREIHPQLFPRAHSVAA